MLWLKVQRGAGFGEFKTDESFFERIASACGGGGQGTVRTAAVDHGKGVMHGAKVTTAIGARAIARYLADGLI